MPLTPRLTHIRLYPIKSLDPIAVTQSLTGPAGGLTHDRAWALYSVDGKWVNAKRTPAIQLIRARYAPDLTSVTLSVPNDKRGIPTRTFAFPSAHEDAAEWFSVYFDQQIIVRNSPEGFPDDPIANGPTIVSTASLQAVCDWFTLSSERFLGLTLKEVRLRFRTSLEIGVDPADAARGESLPPFWEDQLFSANERNVVRFKIGDVNFEGSNPCARCPVPARDSQTGRTHDGFQKLFTQQRQATLPPWSPLDRFDHFYRLAINTRVPSAECNKPLRVGDPLIL
jgi:uncharacterized protein YcbX